DLGLDERLELVERLLPTEVAELQRDLRRDAALLDAQLDAAKRFLQLDHDLHLAGHARVVELVRVLDALVLHEPRVDDREAVAAAGAEILERHAVAAAFAQVELAHGADEAV